MELPTDSLDDWDRRELVVWLESVPDTFRGMGSLEVLNLGGADSCRSIGGGIFFVSSISSGNICEA